jgi:hypothetical protein
MKRTVPFVWWDTIRAAKCCSVAVTSFIERASSHSRNSITIRIIITQPIKRIVRVTVVPFVGVRTIRRGSHIRVPEHLKLCVRLDCKHYFVDIDVVRSIDPNYAHIIDQIRGLMRVIVVAAIREESCFISRN